MVGVSSVSQKWLNIILVDKANGFESYVLGSKSQNASYLLITFQKTLQFIYKFVICSSTNIPYLPENK